MADLPDLSDVSRPTLGRIVHYYHAGVGRSFAAVVTGTQDEVPALTSPWHVNLSVEWDGVCMGGIPSTRNVPFLAGARLPMGGHWHWPPRAKATP